MTIIVLILIQTIIAAAHFKSMDKVYFAMSIVLMVLSLASCGFVFPLFGFHVLFVSKNMTTNEYIKDNWEEASGSPFEKDSCFKNCVKVMTNSTAAKADPNELLKIRH